jgi:phage-related protein
LIRHPGDGGRASIAIGVHFQNDGVVYEAIDSSDRNTKLQGGHGEAIQSVSGGVFEIALKHRGNAFRAIYAVQIGDDIWVVDAFQKKSKSGIKTPQMDIDRIKERIRRLKKALR